MTRRLLTVVAALAMLLSLMAAPALATNDEWHDGQDHFWKYDFDANPAGQPLNDPDYWGVGWAPQDANSTTMVYAKTSCAQWVKTQAGCNYVSANWSTVNRSQALIFLNPLEHTWSESPPANWEIVARVLGGPRHRLIGESIPYGSDDHTAVAGQHASDMNHCGTVGYTMKPQYTPWVPTPQNPNLSACTYNGPSTGNYWWLRLQRYGDTYRVCSAIDTTTSALSRVRHGTWDCQSQSASIADPPGDGGLPGAAHKVKGDTSTHPHAVDVFSYAEGPHCADRECAWRSAAG